MKVAIVKIPDSARLQVAREAFMAWFWNRHFGMALRATQVEFEAMDSSRCWCSKCVAERMAGKPP